MRTRSAVSQLAGSKRHADDSNLNDDQRFTKRFNLLSLDHQHTSNNSNTINGNSNLYIPVPSTSSTTTSNGTTSAVSAPHLTTTRGRVEDGDSMLLDDTRDRIYIHDLDRELADLDASSSDNEDRLIFLPDIEKRFTRIPHQVLVGDRASTAVDDGHNELVLYAAPKSLSVDEGHDAVRKAVLEARARAREQAARAREVERERVRREDMERKYDSDQLAAAGGVETAHGYASGYAQEEQQQQGFHEDDDPDAMDIG